VVKTHCPISRQEFREKAKPIRVQLDNHALVANVKEFSTGSVGWFASGKMDVDVGGKLVTVQIGLTVTAVGSKELPKE
jgi:hypothetical protein